MVLRDRRGSDAQMVKHYRRLSSPFRRSVVVVMLGVCLAQSGCVPADPLRGKHSPLLFDKGSVARADTLLILIPGTLTSIDIFDPVKVWPVRGYAPVYYRFPGFDGLPADHVIGMEDAADRIAEFANRYPEKAVRLLGYSTGAPIAVLASGKIHSDDVRIAALSPAVAHAGGAATGLRVTGNVLASTLRTGTRVREDVWLDYYRTLLFGRKGRSNPALADRSDRLVADKKVTLILPGPALANAHSRGLRHWSVPRDLSLDPCRVRFFIGLADPVFSTAQTMRFSRQLGGVRVVGYPGDGHLLFRTREPVFADVLAFFETEIPDSPDPWGQAPLANKD